jgi:outer membrane protein OmpA-like peptidoglycan-associated protein
VKATGEGIMRTLKTSILLGAALTALAATACGPTIPPRELADARTQYQLSAQGPAATETPAQLHNAKIALDQAENIFADKGDTPEVKDKAYVALRRAQLADVMAQVQMDNKAKTAADLQAQKLQAQQLQNANANLQNTQGQLAKTQDQLDREKAARAEAERKAAQALADLAKIANVKQETRGTVITLSGSVLFETDKSALLPSAIAKLNDVADALIKGNPDANITIEGHSDSTGNRDHNLVLSQQRAESVKQALVGRGVAADRIKTVGVGPDRPIADNKSPEGRANNRRVEIIVDNGNNASGTNPSTGNNNPSSTK